MKTLILALASVALITTSAQAFVTLDAVLSGSQSDQRSTWETTYGSYHHNTATSAKLDVVVRNAGNQPVSVEIQTIFVARSLGGSEDTRTVCGYDHKAVALKPSMDTKFSVISPEVTLDDLNLAALGRREVKGQKVEGWVVIVSDQNTGAELAQKTSTSGMESFSHDKAKRQAAIAAFTRTPSGTVAKPVLIEGKVHSLYLDGVVVDCTASSDTTTLRAKGTVFVIGYPKTTGVAVGGPVRCLARYTEEHWYIEDGVKHTVSGYLFTGGSL